MSGHSKHDAKKPIGLIGLGLLGTALARRLLAAHFKVIGFDVDDAKCADLKKIGGEAADSVADIAQRCRRIVLAVFSTDQVEQVVEGEDGLLAHPGQHLVLCMSTCDPGRVAALAQRAAELGLTLLDAPVSGSSDQVRRGEGLGLLGGDPSAIAAASDLLDVLVPRRHQIGAVGDAGRAKLAINLILGLNRLAMAEGLVFAERLGLDLDAFLKVTRDSAAYSQVMDVKGEKMLRGDYTPQGKVVQHLKDVQLILDQAKQAGQRLPLAELHQEVLESCRRHGEGAQDNCIVIEEIRRRRE
jgi:2-hydroxy-3-oxopropionate reductase